MTCFCGTYRLSGQRDDQSLQVSTSPHRTAKSPHIEPLGLHVMVPSPEGFRRLGQGANDASCGLPHCSGQWLRMYKGRVWSEEGAHGMTHCGLISERISGEMYARPKSLSWLYAVTPECTLQIRALGLVAIASVNHPRQSLLSPPLTAMPSAPSSILIPVGCLTRDSMRLYLHELIMESTSGERRFYHPVCPLTLAGRRGRLWGGCQC